MNREIQLDRFLHLIKWKMRLTWRMYTRNTLASLESILFFAVYAIWLIFSWYAFFHMTNWGESYMVPRALIFCDLFTLTFLSWLIFALMGYRLNESYDLNRLIVYPLPVRTIFTANLVGAFTDISVLLPLVSYLAVFSAINPSPELIPIGLLMILLLLLLQITAGLTLVNTLYVLLPRLNLVKVGTWVVMGLLIWVGLLRLGIVQYPMTNPYILFREFGIQYFRPYPAGQIGIALDAYMSGNPGAMMSPMLGFIGWLAGVLVLNYLILAYWMELDVVKHTSSERSGEKDLAPKLLDGVGSFLQPVVGRQAYAFYRKDTLEFASRSPYFFIYKILPGTVAPIIILLAMQFNMSYMELSSFPIMEKYALTAAMALVLFIVVAQGNLFAGNQFGLEDRNIKGLMVLPTPRKAFLLGKNLFLGGLFLLDAVVLSLLSLFFYPSAYLFFSILTVMVTMFVLIISIGNYTSALWPYWMPLDKPSFSLRSTVILGLVNSIVTIILALIMIPALAAVYFPWHLGIDWLGFLLMPVVIVGGFVFHRLTLNSAVGVLESNEFLLLRRIADREQL